MPVSQFYKFQSKPLQDDTELDLMRGINLPKDETVPYRGPLRAESEITNSAAESLSDLPMVKDEPQMIETTLVSDKPNLDSKEGLFAALASRYPDITGTREQRADKPDYGREGALFEAASRAASAAGSIGGKQAESGASKIMESYRQADRQKAKDLIDDEGLAASEISGFARNFIRTNLGVDVPETVTASQLKTFMPAITQQYLATKRAEQAQLTQETQMQRVAETAAKVAERQKEQQSFSAERQKEQQEFMAEQKRLDREQRERESKMRAEKPEKTIGGVGADVAKVEMDLAKQFRGDKTVQAYQLMQNEMRQLESLAAANTPSSDQALITKFAKILDPGSVVRESEFAITERGGGLLNSMRNQLDKVAGKGRLQPEQRQQLINAARQLTSGVGEEYRKKRQEFSRQGSLYGARPEAIIGAEPVMPSAAEPLSSQGGLAPEKKARLEELRKKLRGGQ